MSSLWNAQDPGVVEFPSGRLVRGRGLRRGLPEGPVPTLGVYLVGRPPPEVPWESRWVKWRDFWVPSSVEAATSVLSEGWERALTGRVEVACGGGVGRTGTALAIFAVLDGLAAPDAVAFVRERYDPRAVEAPWQWRFVERFSFEGRA